MIRVVVQWRVVACHTAAGMLQNKCCCDTALPTNAGTVVDEGVEDSERDEDDAAAAAGAGAATVPSHSSSVMGR